MVPDSPHAHTPEPGLPGGQLRAALRRGGLRWTVEPELGGDVRPRHGPLDVYGPHGMSRGRGRCGLHPSPHHLRRRVGCGGVGIWYKHRHFLPGRVPLGRGGGPEDRVKRELARGTVFPGA